MKLPPLPTCNYGRDTFGAFVAERVANGFLRHDLFEESPFEKAVALAGEEKVSQP